jgi:hypothetical protein
MSVQWIMGAEPAINIISCIVFSFISVTITFLWLSRNPTKPLPVKLSVVTLLNVSTPPVHILMAAPDHHSQYMKSEIILGLICSYAQTIGFTLVIYNALHRLCNHLIYNPPRA